MTGVRAPQRGIEGGFRQNLIREGRQERVPTPVGPQPEAVVATRAEELEPLRARGLAVAPHPEAHVAKREPLVAQARELEVGEEDGLQKLEREQWRVNRG